MRGVLAPPGEHPLVVPIAMSVVAGKAGMSYPVDPGQRADVTCAADAEFEGTEIKSAGLRRAEA